jgi:hypothetical protein
MFRATVEGTVVTVSEKVKERDGNKVTVSVYQLMQSPPGKPANLMFVESENPLKDVAVGKKLTIPVVVYPYGRKDGSGEVAIKAEV